MLLPPGSSVQQWHADTGRMLCEGVRIFTVQYRSEGTFKIAGLHFTSGAFPRASYLVLIQTHLFLCVCIVLPLLLTSMRVCVSACNQQFGAFDHYGPAKEHQVF